MILKVTNEAFKNIERVVNFEDNNIDVLADMDIVTADAYNDSIVADDHLEEVKDNLADKAAAVILDAPEAPDVIDNMYTEKLTLDESIAPEFKPATLLSDDDGMDVYLDYDMFDFIYGLVTDTWPKPKNPLDHRIRKFMYTGSDDYINTNSNKGTSQVATEGDGTIVVYADEPRDFNDIRDICNLYGFRYEGPRPRRSTINRWKFSFKIYVPMTTDYYPMLVEDYFASRGMTLEDVMPLDFVQSYRKHQAKEVKEIDTIDADIQIEKIYNKYVRQAANSNDDLNIFINDMFSEMEQAGLKFSRNALKKRFEAEFNDDFDDED